MEQSLLLRRTRSLLNKGEWAPYFLVLIIKDECVSREYGNELLKLT